MARTDGYAAHHWLELALNPPRWSCERWITAEHGQPESCGSHYPDGRGQPVSNSIPEEEGGNVAVLLGGRKRLALEMEKDGDDGDGDGAGWGDCDQWKCQ